MDEPTIKPRLTDVDLGEVLGIGAALGVPRTFGTSAPFLTLPKTFALQSLESLLPTPIRAKGNLVLADAASFIRYVNKHKDIAGQASASRLRADGDGGAEKAEAAADPDDRQTVILVDPITSRFRAIFDAHASDQPGWGELTATYDCPIAPEWNTWKGTSGKKMTQEDFAFFIEQNMIDIVKPTGGEMLQVVTTLKSTKNVAFDTGIRLSDGQVQLKYHEESKTGAGENGQLAIPEEIGLGIPVYIGAEAYAVTAKFRYRIDGTKLFMWYDLLRPHKIEEDALKKIVSQVASGTGIAPYTSLISGGR